MKEFTENQKLELIGLLDIRYDTITDDADSADVFETEDSLTALRSKLEANSTRYTDSEAKWMIRELLNRLGIADEAPTVQERNAFVRSLENAIDKLVEAHNIDLPLLENRIANFENIYQ